MAYRPPPALRKLMMPAEFAIQDIELCLSQNAAEVRGDDDRVIVGTELSELRCQRACIRLVEVCALHIAAVEDSIDAVHVPARRGNARLDEQELFDAAGGKGIEGRVGDEIDRGLVDVLSAYRIAAEKRVKIRIVAGEEY
jgi:hypothetical protein